jgi:hypothetical protein
LPKPCWRIFSLKRRSFFVCLRVAYSILRSNKV